MNIQPCVKCDCTEEIELEFRQYRLLKSMIILVELLLKGLDKGS
jgi:hypothetical protein